MPQPRGPEGKITGLEFGQRRAYLAQNGVSQAEIDDAIGTSANNRTRLEVADDLRSWSKVLETV